MELENGLSRLIAILTVVLFSSIIFPHNAAASPIECGYCTTPWDFEDNAKYRGDGEYTIYNIQNNVVKTFVVTGWGERPIEFDPVGITAQELQPAQVYVTYVDQLNQIYSFTAGSMRLYADIDAGDLGPIPGMDWSTDASDVINDPALRGRIGDALDRGLPGIWPNLQAMFEIGYTGLLGFLGSGQALFTIVITLPNGSKVEYQYTAGQRNVSYVRGRSRSAAGHLLPETFSEGDIGNSTWYSHNGYDLSEISNHIQSMGIYVISAGSGGGPIKAITCTTELDSNGEIVERFCMEQLEY